MRRNKQSPLVSIITPVYRAEKYLAECIDSLLSQTYSNLEIILVNDGSPDTSGQIISEYAKKDSRIKEIHKENGGVSAAKNTGIEQSTGDYITFIDSDDYIRTDFVENLVSDMENCNVSIATTGTDMLPVESDSIPNVRIYDRLSVYEKMFYGTLENAENGIQMLNRALISDNNLRFNSSKKIGEDFDFFIQALKFCGEVAVDYRKMYYYRPNPTSAMNQQINQDLMRSIETFYSIGSELTLRHPRLKRAVNTKKFNDSVALAMRSYHARNKWQKDYSRLMRNIKALKWQVLLDKKARKKVRAAAFVYCIVGNKIGTIILRRIKK